MNQIRYWADHFDRQQQQHPDDAVAALNFSNQKLMNQVHEEILACIDWPRVRPGGRVLDTGCGTGALLTRAMDAGRARDKVDGLIFHATDIAREMLKKTRQAAGGAACAFSQMSVGEMAFADGTFDLVLASESLQYTDPYDAILDLIRMTRNTGQIVISIPNSRSPFIQRAEKKHQGRFSGLDYHRAADVLAPRVASFSVKPLIFAENQEKRPYEKRALSAELTEKDVLDANRFVLKLIR